MRSDILMRKWYIPVTILILLFMLAGCFSIIKGWSEESFRNAEFSDEAMSREGLAIIPVIILKDTLKKGEEPGGAIPSAPYAESTPAEDRKKEKKIITRDAYRVILNEILMSNIQSRRPSFRLVSPSDVLKRLNDAGLTNTYLKFNSDFPKVGFDSKILKKFGDTLNRRYLLITQAVVTESKTEASFIIIWTFGRKSVLQYVKISGQIWDTVTGQQMWEGLGIGYNRLSAYESTPLIEEIVGEAVDSLLEKIIP